MGPRPLYQALLDNSRDHNLVTGGTGQPLAPIGKSAAKARKLALMFMAIPILSKNPTPMMAACAAGSLHAYKPKGSLDRGGQRAKVASDYEAWSPDA